MKKTKVITIFLSALLCALLILSGCGNKVEAPVATSDEASSETKTEESANTVISSTADPIASSETATEDFSGELSDNSNLASSGSVVNSNSSGNHKPNTNTSGGSVADAGPSDTAKRCTITVGSKGYVTNVGDTVTYTFYLTTPKKVEDVQAALTYDSRMLKLRTTEAEDLFPVMGSSVIFNTAIKDTVKFNAVNISGFDFTQRGALITAEFEVLRNGGTAISTAIEIMSEKGGDYYVDSFKMSDAITCEETLAQ